MRMASFANFPLLDIRRWAAIWCAALVLLALGPQAASAVTVLLVGQDQPLHGYLVSADDKQIVVRVLRSDGVWREQTIARSQIDVLHQPVDAERLAGLDPAKPKDYRDYAEELAEKLVDPEARDASLRLYLIAAHLDPEGLGRGALLGMSGLARSPAEADRFRAAAFLVDPAHDPRLLARTSAPAGDAPLADLTMSLEIRALWRALELLRKGHQMEANQLGRRPGIEQFFAKYEDVLSQAEFLAACEDRVRRAEPPGPALTAKILRIERRISAELLAIKATEPATQADWSQLSAEDLAQTVRPLSLHTLTEFNPRACVFRDGKWQVP